VAREGLTVVHSIVGRKSAEDAIPLVRLIPMHPSGRLTIISHPQGKAALAVATGEPTPLVQSLLALGQSVVGYDPLFVGEALDPRNPVSHRPETDHFETYNPVLAADQMQDLATVLAWSRAQPAVREVSLVAEDRAGLQALVARPVLQGLARTVIELQGLPDSTGEGGLPAMLELPGLFQFGGFKVAAALTAPAPLWLYGQLRALDLSWPKTAYEHAGAPQLLRIDANQPDARAVARWVDRGE
jgi:hypothetical protein